MHTSVLDKIHQEIISNVGDVFILYHIVLIDMLDFKNMSFYDVYVAKVIDNILWHLFFAIFRHFLSPNRDIFVLL
jgi:hypothetical protein